jgi:hypothetical protein
MGWNIQCCNGKCKSNTWANNIVDLITNHRDADGWFVCGSCRARGYVQRSYNLQELGDKWEPYLRGVIPLGSAGEVYQPFVFLISYDKSGPAESLWFSYYMAAFS